MKKVDPEIEALVRLFQRLKKKKLKRVGTRRNPQKAASAARARWDLLFKSAKHGVNVADYITAKGNPVTLKNAIGRGYIELA
jgi:hypothetical protein